MTHLKFLQDFETSKTCMFLSVLRTRSSDIPEALPLCIAAVEGAYILNKYLFTQLLRLFVTYKRQHKRTKHFYTNGNYSDHMVDKTTDNKLRILSLYRLNYLAQYHTREMAKLTKKSHVTLLPHLNTLEKDKVLTAKMVGKNKMYTLNLDNILTKSYLTISELFESILYQEQIFLIKKINTEISKLNLSGSLILFGSYAKKTFNEESDIDLFCLGELKETDMTKIKAIGKVYGKTINLKTATIQNFESGLRKKDVLIVEILKYHLILQNADTFINALWRYYHEIR